MSSVAYGQGSTYSLYVNVTDHSGTPIDAEQVLVNIYYTQEELRFPVVEDASAQRLGTGLYYYPHKIANDARDGTYLATIECDVDGITSRGIETFIVGGPSREAAINLVSVVGAVVDELSIPLGRAEVVAMRGSRTVAKAIVDPDGNWGLRLEPGEYLLNVIFEGYISRLIELTVPSDQAWINLDTIQLRPKEVTLGQGDGSRKVTDTVRDSEGRPIINVRVRAHPYGDNKEVLAQDYTDEEGRWVLHLDPGTYTIRFYKYGYQVPNAATWEVT